MTFPSSQALKNIIGDLVNFDLFERSHAHFPLSGKKKKIRRESEINLSNFLSARNQQIKSN